MDIDKENQAIIEYNQEQNKCYGTCPIGLSKDVCQYCPHSKMSSEDYELRCNYKEGRK